MVLGSGGRLRAYLQCEIRFLRGSTARSLQQLRQQRQAQVNPERRRSSHSKFSQALRRIPSFQPCLFEDAVEGTLFHFLRRVTCYGNPPKFDGVLELAMTALLR